MGYAHERGAAARNLLRARAHGHEDAIADAETLARGWLGSDYGDDGEDEVEEYIADHYADFTPEPPAITDDMVERACQVYTDDPYRPANGTLHITWETLVLVSPEAADDARAAMRAALEAALTTKENEA